MKEKTVFLTYILLTLLLISGCTTKQLTQAVYDSAKSDECRQTQGQATCDPNKQ